MDKAAMSHTANSAEVLALEACSELEALLASDTTQITAVDKKDAVVRAIAQLRVTASGLSDSGCNNSRAGSAEDLSMQGAPTEDLSSQDASAEVQSPGPNDPGHLLRGVSAAFMLGVFLLEVVAHGLSRDSNVHEVEPEVIRGKGKDVQCPRDGKLGAAYVDCVPNGQAGLASVMLSYSWGYTTGDIADTLQEFCRTSGRCAKSTFFWVCCLCINQQ